MSAREANAALTITTIAPAATSFYTAIGTGVSANGLVVTGYGTFPSITQQRAFRWTSAGGEQNLGILSGTGSSYAFATNADGSVVAGTSSSTSGNRAFRWTSAGGMVSLGVLTGGSSSQGYSVNADGSVVVGDCSLTAGGRRAYRWTSAGMVSLGTLTGGTISSATGVSADGSVVAGYSTSSSGQRAFRWTSAGGMQSIGVITGGTFSAASAISADGSAITGDSTSPAGDHAFRWTSAGMIDLGVLPDATGSVGSAISGDGSVIVGSSTLSSGSNHAFMWTTALGMVDLNTYLPTLGLNLSAWASLDSASGISPDGSTIVGTGTLAGSGSIRAWIVTGLPTSAVSGACCTGTHCTTGLQSACLGAFQGPNTTCGTQANPTTCCPANFDGTAGVTVSDIFAFLRAWFAHNTSADFDHSGTVNVSDIFAFLRAWFAKC